MLEAVRRGADLHDSGGEPAEVAQRLSQGNPEHERPFMQKLTLFLELANEQHLFAGIRDEHLGETTGRVFREAVRFHESRGAILLTGIDGGGGEEHGGVAEENVVIHVNPAWFADLVRRVVDVRLLDPARQGKVLESLSTFAPRRSLRALSTQHKRFFQAGEVSRDYLDFLLLRDMKLGPASQAAPPLKMTREECGLMVKSLLDVRFMFSVRDEAGGVVRDRYVVASCLPDHLDSAVDTGYMLELEMGGALFLKVLEVDGAHVVPSGLVTRLLAWCGRGKGRIQA